VREEKIRREWERRRIGAREKNNKLKENERSRTTESRFQFNDIQFGIYYSIAKIFFNIF
jgi:hypothetical protein